MIPISLDNLSNLEKLFLRNNRLSGSIPPFSNLKNLRGIYLTNNNLSGPIPESFVSLIALSNLYLSEGNPGLCLPLSLQDWAEGIREDSDVWGLRDCN